MTDFNRWNTGAAVPFGSVPSVDPLAGVTVAHGLDVVALTVPETAVALSPSQAEQIGMRLIVQAAYARAAREAITSD